MFFGFFYLMQFIIFLLLNEKYIRLNCNLHANTKLYDCTQHPHSHTSTPIPPMYSTLPTNGNMTSYISSPDSQYSTLSNKTSEIVFIFSQ